MDLLQDSGSRTFHESENKFGVVSVKEGWSLARFVVKISGGAIKTEATASVILWFIAFLLILISASISMKSSSSAELKAPPGRKIYFPPDGPPRLKPL